MGDVLGDGKHNQIFCVNKRFLKILVLTKARGFTCLMAHFYVDCMDLNPSLLERGLHSILQRSFHKQSRCLHHMAADFHKHKLSKVEQGGSYNTFCNLRSEVTLSFLAQCIL